MSERLKYCWLFFTWSPYFQVKNLLCNTVLLIHFHKRKHTNIGTSPVENREKYEISRKCKNWPKFCESAKNGRNGAHGLNCIIFVNSEVIFEIYDKNYPIKKFQVSRPILNFLPLNHFRHFSIFGLLGFVGAI